MDWEMVSYTHTAILVLIINKICFGNWNENLWIFWLFQGIFTVKLWSWRKLSFRQINLLFILEISQYQRNKIWPKTPKFYAGFIQNLSATPVSNSSVFYCGKIIIPVSKERAYPDGFFGILYFYLTYIRSL